MGGIGDFFGEVFGGLGEFLFGEEGQPPSAQIIFPQAYAELRQPIAELLKSIFTEGFTEGGGPFAAPLSSMEKELLQQIFTKANKGGFSQAAGEHLFRTIQGDFLSPESNPFLQQTIEAAQRPVLENFQDVIMPRLRAQFTQAGQFIQPKGSSPFDRAAALSSRGLADALGDISTGILSQNYQAERARQQQAALGAPGFTGQRLRNLTTGLQAVALPRMIQQFGIDRGLQEFHTRMNTLLRAVGLTTGTPVTFPGTEGSQGAFGPFLSALGGGLGQQSAGPLMAFLTNLFSDRRLKRDIAFAGQQRGVNWYRFRFVDDPDDAPMRLGVMADEVIGIVPEAVTLGEEGYLRVDYSML